MLESPESSTALLQPSLHNLIVAEPVEPCLLTLCLLGQNPTRLCGLQTPPKSNPSLPPSASPLAQILWQETLKIIRQGLALGRKLSCLESSAPGLSGSPPLLG